MLLPSSPSHPSAASRHSQQCPRDLPSSTLPWNNSPCPRRLPAIAFGTAEHIEPLDLTKKLGDDKILDEDKFVAHVLAFSFQNPAHVHVKIETELLEDSHCAREVESKADAADDVAKLIDAAPTLL